MSSISKLTIPNTINKSNIANNFDFNFIEMHVITANIKMQRTNKTLSRIIRNVYVFVSNS